MEVIQYSLGMSNGFFIKDRGIIAVDTGAELGIEPFKKVCKESGINPKDISLIVITHEHVDHFLNAGVMKALTGAPLVCHRYAAKSLRYALFPNVAPRNAIGRKIMSEMNPEDEPCPYLPAVDPDLIFEGEFDLNPYGINGKLTETPGHSRSCVSVVTADRQALVGDMLVDNFAGRATLAFLCYSTPEECNPILFNSCEKLLELADKFYSGHGGPFTKEEFETALQEAKQEARQEAVL